MAIAYAVDEIRKDARELTRIAIEDNISKTQLSICSIQLNTDRLIIGQRRR